MDLKQPKYSTLPVPHLKVFCSSLDSGNGSQEGVFPASDLHKADGVGNACTQEFKLLHILESKAVYRVTINGGHAAKAVGKRRCVHSSARLAAEVALERARELRPFTATVSPLILVPAYGCA